MGDIAVRVSGLGKQYQIGKLQTKRTRLYDVLADSVAAPFRRVGQLLSGNKSGASDLTETMWALRDVSFEVKKGEIIGIIGRNGSGKSTLLKILSRITAPSEGFADVYGRVGALLEVGTGFHPDLTGRENVYLNGSILGMTRQEIDRKFDEIVAFSEVEKFIDTPVKHYSSGMGLRLGFAVAAHLEPEILIVDEVLAVGDAAFQKKCIGKMGEVAGEGRTVLFVSHNMAAVRNLCGSIALLNAGHLIETGQTDQVIDRYLSTGNAQAHHTVLLPDSDSKGPARGLKLSFTDQTGQARSQFRMNERWLIELVFEIRKPLNHCDAAVGLVTLDSTEIATYWSKPSDLATGQYQVTFEVDLPLSHADIQFNVAISTYEHIIYFARNSGQITISEVAIDAQPYKNRGGLLITPYNTEISTL
jgi:lipopolysaccharide transport system ATP-binding protein